MSRDWMRAAHETAKAMESIEREAMESIEREAEPLPEDLIDETEEETQEIMEWSKEFLPSITNDPLLEEPVKSVVDWKRPIIVNKPRSFA